MTKKMMLVLTPLTLAVGACGGTTATADPSAQTQAQSTSSLSTDGGDARRPPHPHGPPPAAFEACQSKAVGDTCTVTLGSESLPGKCVAPPPDAPDTRIVCRPDKMPEHGPGAGRPPGGPGGVHGAPPPPPPEVFAACDGKSADATCTVTLGDHTIEGTCKPPPPGVSETRLGCAPARPLPPPR